MKIKAIAATALGMACILVAHAAHADTVSAQFGVGFPSLVFQNTPQDQTIVTVYGYEEVRQHAEASGGNGGSAFASVAVSLSGLNYIPGGNAFAVAEVKYTVVIDGAPGVLVPVYAVSHGSNVILTTDKLTFTAGSQVTVSGPGVSYVAGDSTTPIDNTGLLYLTSGSSYSVDVWAGAYVAWLNNSSGQASAFADPYFYIDPTFDHANDFSILVSDGISNTSAVPESSTWAMMILGFAGVGFLAYRRRNQFAAV